MIQASIALLHLINRSFAREYEQLTAVAETLITIAASATLIRRRG